MWVTNYGSNSVTKLNAATGALIGNYTVGTNPYGIKYDNTNNVLWVVNNTSNNITKLNAATGAILATYTAGTDIHDVTCDYASNSILVTNYGSDNVTKLNASTGALIATYAAGTKPRNIVYDHINKAIWVVNDVVNTVTKIVINDNYSDGKDVLIPSSPNDRIVVNNNTGSITIPIKNDGISEINETIFFELLDSNSNVLATTTGITILNSGVS